MCLDIASAKVGRQTPGRSDFPKRRFSSGGATRLRSWLPGAGADTLIFSAGFHDWFYGLAGTVNSGVCAPQMLCLNRVSLVIRFPGMYTACHTKPRQPRRSPRPPRPSYCPPKSPSVPPRTGSPAQLCGFILSFSKDMQLQAVQRW